MKLINSSKIEVKKSKFISYYYNLDNQSEVKEILNDIKKAHKNAKHVAYAYIFNNTAGKSDDKEPSGTAGGPLYNLLVLNNLTNALIIVVRYFGGIKLGVGPLTRAYKEAGIMALKK